MRQYAITGASPDTPCPPYSAFSSSTLLNVPSSLQFLPQGMLFAPGMWPPRWQVSGSPGGARISPVNSAGLRTSTSAAFFAADACCTSGRNARSDTSGPLALYVFAATLGLSVDSSRPSASHFFRPPSIMRTSSCPYIFNCQNAHAANQLLLSPYRMIVVLLSIPLLPRSSSSFLSGMMSRVRVSQSSVVQFHPAAPGTWP